MLWRTLAAVATLAAQAAAHGYISNLWNPTVNPEGYCIRPYEDVVVRKEPVTDRSSAEMTCGHLPGAADAADTATCAVTAGDDIALQWTVMYSGHLGVVIVYMAELSSAGDGDAWWKVYYDGYHPAEDHWATTTLWDDGGMLWMTVPDYLPTGDYLIRGEVISLHNASYVDGAQFFINCLQVHVENGSDDTVDVADIPKVAIPGYYTSSTPGLHVDIWIDDLSDYPVIGPALYTPGVAESAAVSS
ncbi:glycoside hydrolase, partial [Dipodascopsis tothii]|uniref:glycoside hydrolase n=1 Tax=Dipodascopsis tothii TaxID=44089 RepID=UPI0034CD7E0E